MKVKILIAALIVPFIAYSVPKIHVKVYPVEVKKLGANAYNVKFKVEYSGLEKDFFKNTYVVIPTEAIIASGSVEDYKIYEHDFLFSQINFDLNNDSDLNETYTLNCIEKRCFINKYEVFPVSGSVKFQGMDVFDYLNRKGEPILGKVGKNGNPFIVYSIDFPGKKMMVGFGGKIDFEKFPNPNVELRIVKSSDASSAPVSSIAGIKNYQQLCNRMFFEDDEGLLKDSVWGIKPFELNSDGKNDFEFTISSSPPFAVVAMVNLSLEKGTRLRSAPSVTIVKE